MFPLIPFDSQRQPEAVIVPGSYVGKGSDQDKIARLQSEFETVLRATRVSSRNHTTHRFLTGDPHDSLFFPTDSHRAGQPRYDWSDRGDGVLYGYLKETPSATA